MAVALREGFEVFCLTVDYGQRHRTELTSARRIAAALGAKRHLVFRMDLSPIGGSALTSEISVPKSRPVNRMAAAIPVTYVPARNTMLLSVALGWAETLGALDIFIGVNAVDYSGYPDCRPAFIRSFERTANLATRAGVEGGRFHVRAPLLRLTKAAIIRKAAALGVPLELTHSCYDPDSQGRACGGCDSCILRRKGFREAGIPDPTRYADGEVGTRPIRHPSAVRHTAEKRSGSRRKG
ncbi:7-cyano-7-deazaguanine synthase QueC [bacterium]|nr:7-cyano-7-deazaguanine synthase QueC [bacterium]